MKRMRLFFSAALVAGVAMLMGAGSAAAVYVHGKVEIAQVRPGNNYHYIYVAPKHTVTYSTYNYCATDDDTMIMAAKDALEKNLSVYMNCSYGTWSNSYGGTLTFFNIYRSY